MTWIKVGRARCDENAQIRFRFAEVQSVQLTLRSNHAMRLMMFCALTGGKPTPVARIAKACNMNEKHLAKIANALAADGFLETIRGRRGGVRLARPAQEINVGDVVASTEIGCNFVECLDRASNTCPLIDACRFRSIIGRALEAFLGVLNGYTLADLVTGRPELRATMGLGELELAADDPAPARAAGSALHAG